MHDIARPSTALYPPLQVKLRNALAVVFGKFPGPQNTCAQDCTRGGTRDLVRFSVGVRGWRHHRRFGCRTGFIRPCRVALAIDGPHPIEILVPLVRPVRCSRCR